MSTEPAFMEFKKATLKIKDGTGTPNEITVHLGDGAFQYTETRNIQYRLRRGKLGTVREGDEAPVELSMQAEIIAITGAAGGSPTVNEALKKVGLASAWLTTGASCEPYSVDLELTFDYQTECATVHDETIAFPQFRHTSINFDLREAYMDISGSCNVTTISSTRTAPGP